MLCAVFSAPALFTKNAAPPPPQESDNILVGFIRANCMGRPYSSENRLGPESFDCSGLIWYACSNVGIEMSSGGTDSQLEYGKPIDMSELMPGDLIFFDYENDGVTDHAAVYSGNGNIIHATRSSVRETPLDSPTGVYENQTFRDTAAATRRVAADPCAPYDARP